MINLYLIQQKAELRCLLPRSLLNHGFFPPHTPQGENNDKHLRSQVCSHSWSGQRKSPSYVNTLVFPEDFLTALRTIAMKENELYQVISLLEEVCFVQSLSIIEIIHLGLVVPYFYQAKYNFVDWNQGYKATCHAM